MSRLDDELKSVFRRREPSEDFTERVMARIALQGAAPDPVAGGWWRPLLAGLSRALVPQPMRWALGSALAFLLIVGSLGVYRQRERERERIEGEMAAAQVMYALQVASVKLNVAQKKVLAVEKQ